MDDVPFLRAFYSPTAYKSYVESFENKQSCLRSNRLGYVQTTFISGEFCSKLLKFLSSAWS